MRGNTMFGWHANYVRHTRKKIKKIRLHGRIRVVVPANNEVPYEPFLPFIGDEEPEEPLKSRHKRKVFYIKRGGEGFYLKKYSYRFTQRHYAPVRGFFWTIPIAQRQMQKMLFLRECGAGVVEPVMTLIRRYGMIKQESLLVMRECPGVLLKDFMKQVDDFDRRLNVISQTFHFLNLSHSNHIHHGDINTHNFIVTPKEKLKAIDLDERKTKWLGALGNRKELKKWVRKSVKILKIGPENGCSNGRRAFERMLEATYPAALKFDPGLERKEDRA